MPDEQQQQQPVEQPVEQPNVTLTGDQLSQLVKDSGAAAGTAAADALAASLGDSQTSPTVTFPDSMTVMVTDDQWQELMDARQVDSEFNRQSWQLSNSLNVLTLMVCAALLGAILSQILVSRWRSG